MSSEFIPKNESPKNQYNSWLELLGIDSSKYTIIFDNEELKSVVTY